MDSNHSACIDIASKELSTILEKYNICKSHGIKHAISVCENARKALEYSNITPTQKRNVMLASLLHDADDRKFFPNNHNYENARCVIQHTPNITHEDEQEIVYMIDLVSASKNKDTIPLDLKYHEMLYPRWADRLEALGWGGIVRCWDYTITSKRPLYIPHTIYAISKQDLLTQTNEYKCPDIINLLTSGKEPTSKEPFIVYQTLKTTSLKCLREEIATSTRYQSYKGVSVSMIDHYYDKLLHILVNTGNPYFDQEFHSRMTIMEEFCLDFGKKGYVDYEWYQRSLQYISNNTS